MQLRCLQFKINQPMQKTRLFITGLIVTLFLSACSGVKVLNSWKSPAVKSMEAKSILVIARTNNDRVRKIFEDEIVKQLKEAGMSASASYLSLSKLDPGKKLSEEEIEAFKTSFKEQGYNGVVLTAIKEVQDLSKIIKEGGYYSGGTNYGYNPYYYGSFYGYYNHPYSYSSYGNWEEEKMELKTAYNFVLETLAYNLDLEKDEQLVAIVTSKLEEPDELKTTAKTYVKKMIQAIKK